MKRFAYGFVLVLAAAVPACTDDKDNDDYPVYPGAGSGVEGGEMMRVSGRVCVIEDLREPGRCGTRDASNLTVSAGLAATTTDAEGNFTLDTTADQTDLTVTGTGVTPTTVTMGAEVIPAIDDAIYQQMLESNGLAPSDGTGAILTSVTDNALPAADIALVTTPDAPVGPFFDSTSPLVWGLDGTGQRGVAWVPGVTVGSYDLSYDRILGGQSTLVGGVSVRNGGVTILDTSLVGGSQTPPL